MSNVPVDDLKNWILDPNSIGKAHKSYNVISHLITPPYIHHTEHHVLHVSKRYALLNITELVEGVLKRSEVVDGFMFVSAMHITAGMYVNDAESGLLNDIAKKMTSLAPYDLRGYAHHNTGEDNGDAHLKSILTNHSVTAPITNGKLDFGTWQQIFYAEYDGKRDKRIMMKVTGVSKQCVDQSKSSSSK
jgi:secondary thiamine-phosphate synthase enzyme